MNNERFWQENYEPGVVKEIDQNKVIPLVDYLTRSAEKYPNSIAASNFGATMSYAELDAASRAFAAGLRQQLGLSAGDRVAVMMPNVMQYPVAVFGILRAGMAVVNVNPLYTPRELKHQLKDSGAKAIIILENFANVLEKVIDETDVQHAIVARVGDCLSFPKSLIINFVLKYVKKVVPAWNLPQAVTYKKLIADGSGVKMDDHPGNLDDLAFLQYTGGTTGVSKGVTLSHHNISSNVQQGLEWCTNRFKDAEDVAITALPLYHIFALTANLFFMVAKAGNMVLITNPRDFPGFVKELKNWQMTYITGVNTLFAALTNTPGIEDIDFSKLKISLGGGMAVTSPVARKWLEVTGRPLIEAYGLSETSPAVTINRMDLKEFSGFIGLPLPNTDVKIADDDGNTLAVGEEGELCIKGPQVMAGYWNAPEATAKAFTADGYFKTGDYAMLAEDGHVKILDRKKDMVIVSGFNVYPNEIEDVVSDHPGILEVAAVGISDEKSGERVKLYVVKKPDAESFDEAALISWCREQMTNYKVPKAVEFIDELPKTAVGKILRRGLRDK